jgi:hypothetical protein
VVEFVMQFGIEFVSNLKEIINFDFYSNTQSKIFPKIKKKSSIFKVIIIIIRFHFILLSLFHFPKYALLLEIFDLLNRLSLLYQFPC